MDDGAGFTRCHWRRVRKSLVIGISITRWAFHFMNNAFIKVVECESFIPEFGSAIVDRSIRIMSRSHRHNEKRGFRSTSCGG